MSKYGLHGKLIATPGNASKLADILIKASKLVATAEGCQLYVIGKDKSDANAVWITEIWDTQEDHDKSLSVPGVKELITQAMPMLARKPEKGQELEILGGFGIK
ncbi:MAG: antibiotic biosynthesis monooxygenase [Saprospiraceae bacterium]|nr:antibiotic biosynthesis monooxygenase [Saprospiraceae bacterium]